MTDKYKGHTPGPWSYKDNHISTNYEDIARVYGSDTDEKKANAKLITDAPMLLSQLTVLQQQADQLASDKEALLKVIHGHEETMIGMKEQLITFQQHADAISEAANLYVLNGTIGHKERLKIALHNYETFKKQP